MQRMRVGHACETCGNPSESGRLYFPITIHILVDLVHQAFHSNAPVGPIDGPQTKAIGTVVFFCALREALLVHFLQQHMLSQKLPPDIIERLLGDNKLAHQRFGQLFKSVVGVNWHDAIREISTTRHDFSVVSKLMISASEVRNDFLHNGMAWQATEELATDCVNNLLMLTSMFAMLHNKYIAATRPKT
jgi:hypothetical protein